MQGFTRCPLVLPLLLQIETIRANVIGCLNLADVCQQRDIHMTYYGTGCIFHYDDDFPVDSGKGFKEADKPNFTGSYYSYTKVRMRLLLAASRGAGLTGSIDEHAARGPWVSSLPHGRWYAGTAALQRH